MEVHSFPGANMVHGAHVIRNKTPTFPKAKQVILSLGLNDRIQTNKAVAEENIKKLLEAAKGTFPNAGIHIPMINYNKNLPKEQVGSLEMLNRLIFDSEHAILRLEEEKYSTVADRIHWTPGTAAAMLEHWMQHLNM